MGMLAHDDGHTHEPIEMSGRVICRLCGIGMPGAAAFARIWGSVLESAKGSAFFKAAE